MANLYLRLRADDAIADLLTQLTWPLEKDQNQTTAHHLLHRPYLQSAQASYKQAILHHNNDEVLRKIVRVALPALANSQKERSHVEDSVIKVVLYLFRNIAMINKPDHLDAEEDDSEISRSATIDAFHCQDIFTLLLTVGSGINDEFSTHDVELLDTLFHLVKGVDVEKLFIKQEQLTSSDTRELQSLIGKERSMLRGYARTAPSRHNRFGTMLWMKRNDGKMSTVFGQTATTNDQSTLYEMDKSKKWKKPRRGIKKDLEDPLTEFNGKVHLTASARRHLRSFVEQFLDSSFNPLFLSLRRSIEREVPRLLYYHPRQYFFLISWFLRAESARRKGRVGDPKGTRTPTSNAEAGFSLVASVLGQETFVLLSRRMQKAQDEKDWKGLNAYVKCFTQILETVQDMSESPSDEDQEIAENTLNRMFYEAATHDQLISLLRTFKDQGFGYLDALTDLAHVFLRALERYSKQNVDMQVRRLRKSRKKKDAQNGSSGAGNANDRDVEAEDLQEAHRVSSERKFDFVRFSSRFVNQGSIETFVAFLRYYKELGTEQLKRAHRFLYRAAFKMELSIYLFRADIILLLQKMVKGPDAMDKEDSMFQEWEELVRQVFRLLVKKMKDRPVLGVELLFSKIPNTVYYLENGYEREVRKHAPRAPAELEVKPGLEKEEQIGVAVSVLINQSKADHLTWVKSILISAADERNTWEQQQSATVVESNGNAVDVDRPDNISQSIFGETERTESPSEAQSNIEKQQSELENRANPQPSPILVRPDTSERRFALQRDKYLRLLLALLSFDKLDITDSDIDRDGLLTSWTIPGSLTSAELRSSYDLIVCFEFSPPTYDNDKTAEDFIRRRYVPDVGNKSRRRGETSSSSGSESEGGSIHDDDGTLFPAGGPTARRADHVPKKKSQRRRNIRIEDENTEESALEERRAVRRKLERERAGKVKSQLFISESDDEDNEERDKAFFEKESEMRKRQAREVQRQSLRLRGLLKDGQDIDEDGEVLEDAGTSLGFLTAKREVNEPNTYGEMGDEEDVIIATRPRKRKRRQASSILELSNGSESEAERNMKGDASSQSPEARKRAKARRREPSAQLDSTSDDSDRLSSSKTPPSSQRPSPGPDEQQMADKAVTRINGDVDTMDANASSSDKENRLTFKRPTKEQSMLANRVRRLPFVVESDSDE